MNRKKSTYNLSQFVSSVFLMLSLLWLTVRLPFVYDSQQILSNHTQLTPDEASHACNEEEAANPFGNTTEEKAPSTNSSVSEEYLHDNHIAEYFLSIALQEHTSENSGIYNAFHGEVHVPPPNID